MCNWWVSDCINSSSTSSSSCVAQCGTKIAERASAALLTPGASSTVNPIPSTMSRVPGSTLPPFPQNSTGSVYSATIKSGVKLNTNGIIAVSIVAVLLFLFAFGLIFRRCFFKKGKNKNVLSFLRLRRKRSVTELKAPLNPPGVENTQYSNSLLFLKPELDSEPSPLRPEANNVAIRHLGNLEPANRTLHELGANRQGSLSPLLGATSSLGTDYVQQNPDRSDSDSTFHSTSYFPQSRQGYQDQNTLSNAPYRSAFNVSPPMSSRTNIELDADRSSIELRNTSEALSTTEDTGWQYSAETVSRLEEEERRIDADIEQVRSLKHLREQKFDVQRRLMEAKTGIRDV